MRSPSVSRRTQATSPSRAEFPINVSTRLRVPSLGEAPAEGGLALHAELRGQRPGQLELRPIRRTGARSTTSVRICLPSGERRRSAPQGKSGCATPSVPESSLTPQVVSREWPRAGRTPRRPLPPNPRLGRAEAPARRSAPSARAKTPRVASNAPAARAAWRWRSAGLTLRSARAGRRTIRGRGRRTRSEGRRRPRRTGADAGRGRPIPRAVRRGIGSRLARAARDPRDSSYGEPSEVERQRPASRSAARRWPAPAGQGPGGCVGTGRRRMAAACARAGAFQAPSGAATGGGLRFGLGLRRSRRARVRRTRGMGSGRSASGSGSGSGAGSSEGAGSGGETASGAGRLAASGAFGPGGLGSSWRLRLGLGSPAGAGAGGAIGSGAGTGSSLAGDAGGGRRRRSGTFPDDGGRQRAAPREPLDRPGDQERERHDRRTTHQATSSSQRPRATRPMKISSAARRRMDSGSGTRRLAYQPTGSAGARPPGAASEASPRPLVRGRLVFLARRLRVGLARGLGLGRGGHGARSWADGGAGTGRLGGLDDRVDGLVDRGIAVPGCGQQLLGAHARPLDDDVGLRASPFERLLDLGARRIRQLGRLVAGLLRGAGRPCSPRRGAPGSSRGSPW